MSNVLSNVAQPNLFPPAECACPGCEARQRNIRGLAQNNDLLRAMLKLKAEECERLRRENVQLLQRRAPSLFDTQVA